MYTILRANSKENTLRDQGVSMRQKQNYSESCSLKKDDIKISEREMMWNVAMLVLQRSSLSGILLTLIKEILLPV